MDFSLNLGALDEGKLQKIDENKLYDVTVIGAGPAAVSAAIYSARKGLNVAMIGVKIGGQVLDTNEIENIIGTKSTTGAKFAESLEAHLKDNEVEFFEDFNNKLISPILDIAFVVERNSEVLLIPYTILNLFRKKYSIMERFLHDLTREKLSKSLLSLQNILLIPLKERLLNFLYSLKKNEISLTHEEIAKKLGSSREVISRNLKILEKENFLKMNRKKIIIIGRGEVL